MLLKCFDLFVNFNCLCSVILNLIRFSSFVFILFHGERYGCKNDIHQIRMPYSFFLRANSPSVNKMLIGEILVYHLSPLCFMARDTIEETISYQCKIYIVSFLRVEVTWFIMKQYINLQLYIKYEFWRKKTSAFGEKTFKRE